MKDYLLLRKSLDNKCKKVMNQKKIKPRSKNCAKKLMSYKFKN